MTEHDKQSSGVEAAANAQPSQGRRRLVKGAIIAVPAIFTVRNGFARPNSIPTPEDACTSLIAFQSLYGADKTKDDFDNKCQTPP